MEFEHSFTVPVGIDEAWTVLRDVERISPCIPGGTIDSIDGDEFTGSVRVKVGAIQITYKGSARFAETDPASREMIIEAKGQETRGAGTAQATVRTSLTEDGENTLVKMVTDLAITGKVAQFGRGTMAEVGEKLIGQFADCLSSELSATKDADTDDAPADDDSAASASDSASGAATKAASTNSGPAPFKSRPSDQPIDLLDVAGASVAKRAVPVAGAVGVLVMLFWLLRRRRR